MRYVPLPPRPRPPRWIPTAPAAANNWFGDTDLALVFTFVTNGVRTTFSTVDLPLTFTFVTAGSHTAIGSTIGRNLNFDIFTNGVRTTLSSVTSPFTFTFDTSGAVVIFGDTRGLELNFSFVTAGVDTKRGSAALPVTFTFDAAGTASHLAAVTFPITFGFSTDGFNPDAQESLRLRQSKERLEREPWPGFPDLPKVKPKPFKPGYMKKKVP